MITTKNNEHKKLNFSSEREQSQACLYSAEHEKNQGRKVLNVPNLRFPEFQGEWSVTSLQKDCIVNPTNEKIADKFVYVDLESVKQGQLYKYQILTKENAPSRAQRVLHTDDILFQCVRPYQMNNYMVKETMSDIQWVASTGYAQIRTQTDYPAFLYYVLNTSKYNKAVMVRCTGSSYPAINSEDLSKIPFYKCGIAEQKKIADFLSLLDERIATQNKIIEDLKKLKSAISENLFKAVKGDVVILYEICEIIKGKQINGEFLSEKGKYYVMNGGTEPSGYYSDYNVEANTISISEGGNSCGYVQFNSSPFWSGGHCYTIQKIADNVDNLYLYHYLKSHEDVIMKLRIGSGLPNIQKKDLAMFKIKLPTVEQQKSISTFLSSLERKAEIEEMLLNAMKKEKQYLLRQMFI